MSIFAIIWVLSDVAIAISTILVVPYYLYRIGTGLEKYVARPTYTLAFAVAGYSVLTGIAHINVTYVPDGLPLGTWATHTITALGAVAFAAVLATSWRRIVAAQSGVADPIRDADMFRAAFDYARIGMAIVAPDGRWVRVNDTICSMLGYTRDELLRKTFQDVTHPEDVETDTNFVEKMISGELDTYEMEKRYIRKDGSICYAHLSVSATYSGGPEDKDRQIEIFISQIQDRNRVETQQRELKRLVEEKTVLADLLTERLLDLDRENVNRIRARVASSAGVSNAR